ncbi:hypothetical protein [Prevotella sp.]|nr:hypothetical protein [uncultured Prevotella sp.]
MLVEEFTIHFEKIMVYAQDVLLLIFAKRKIIRKIVKQEGYEK